MKTRFLPSVRYIGEKVHLRASQPQLNAGTPTTWHPTSETCNRVHPRDKASEADWYTEPRVRLTQGLAMATMRQDMHARDRTHNDFKAASSENNPSGKLVTPLP